MAGSRTEKNQSKRRQQRLKNRRSQLADQAKKEKAALSFDSALYYLDIENYNKAETFLKKAVKLDPSNKDALFELMRLGETIQKEELIRDGLLLYYQNGLMENTPADNDAVLLLCRYLLHFKDYRRAADIASGLYNRRKSLKLEMPKHFETELVQIMNNAVIMSNSEKMHSGEKGVSRFPGNRVGAAPGTKNDRERRDSKAPSKEAKKGKTATGEPEKRRDGVPETGRAVKKPTPEVPLTLEIEETGIAKAIGSARPAPVEHYELVMDAVRLRFRETFDRLLCLNTLKGITSLAYQEETARKVLKTFRGRALLADEVGMGKTIEACMILKEYRMRRMIRNVLILAPTPLVSQWREELATKFELDFASTDDRDFRTMGEDFWQQPLIVASVNIAKSRKHFAAVTGREWDLIVADEAHHFKNKNTLNWKLLNSLKKRFLLMLTATPVENNLMELYNLITLLKPGQLKTATAFKEEFMTRGDPADPKNRTRLKGLLDQVMIRNTRAVSNIQIPPRFAETIRTEPTAPEVELYRRVSALAGDINAAGPARSRMILKHLLAEAGSSPAAVEKTLSELVGRRDLEHRHVEEIHAIRNLTRSMGDTGKNKRVLQLIRASGDKLIVFVKYRATLDHLSDVLTWHGIGHSLFHGSMPNAEKDREIDRFKNQNQVLLTTELGGEGRNLQFCSRMINYDLPWNPMRIEQRIGRIHRIGQARDVMIYNLCAAGTVEDYILDILDRKINMFEMVIGEIDMIMGRMRAERDFEDMVYDIWVESASEDDRREAFDKLGTRLKRCRTGYEKTKSLDEKLFGENYEI